MRLASCLSRNRAPRRAGPATAPSSIRWRTLAVLGLLSAVPSRSAFAFGGTAPDLQRQGNFVVTNDASLAFDQEIGHGGATTFSLRPALDYFVMEHLSIGGAIEFDYASGSPAFTDLRIAPEIGYDFALSDTWSFWPQASLPLSLPNPGSVGLALTLFAPFLVHPTEHFFFGAGPGLSQGFTSPQPTEFTASFLVGGYFDH